LSETVRPSSPVRAKSGALAPAASGVGMCLPFVAFAGPM
jgi:hypothetical protein